MPSKNSLLAATLCAALLGGTGVVAAENQPSDKAPKPYAEVAASRARKIVDAISLPDAAVAEAARSAVAEQYEHLHAIDASLDEAIAAARANAQLDATAKAAKIDQARRDADLRTYDLHYAFLARLSVLLAPEQVEQVKDGMTYGVLPLTYRVYCEMVPSLTTEQKRQLRIWLTEAREHAMDGGSSKEKHAWFGKYKGRINNYLAKAGIDMKQAEHEFQQKQKAARNAPSS